MEFEFERRRVTKDDVRELIYREILEYHPQLQKVYVNGIERTNFLYPSAIDHFKNQFAHLEESAGKSGPVIPLERKHASLPRSTIVYSNKVPSKEQPPVANAKDRNNSEESCSRNLRGPDGRQNSSSRTLQPPQRITQAKPGKVVGPVLSYENGIIAKEFYDPQTLVRNPVIFPSAYSSRNEIVKMERQVPNCSIALKLAPDVAIDINSHPYYTSRGGNTNHERVVIDTNLLQAKAQYGATKVGAAHRKVSIVQYGVARMY